MSEKNIWNGNPSQWIGLPVHLFWLFLPLLLLFLLSTDYLLIPFIWLGIGLFKSIWEYLQIKFHKIEITNQRMIEEVGVLSKTTHELELFRVKDISLYQPFILRLVGLSHIHLLTSDKTSPSVIIPGISGGKELKEKLRTIVDKERTRKNVVERDFE